MSKNHNDEEYTAYDEDGNILTLAHCVELAKVAAAIIYYRIDQHNWEVNSFLKKIVETSLFENHKSYVISEVGNLF